MHSLSMVSSDRARDSRVESDYVDYDPSTDSGHGFLFYEYGIEPLWDAIKAGPRSFRGPAEWGVWRKRAR